MPDYYIGNTGKLRSGINPKFHPPPGQKPAKTTKPVNQNQTAPRAPSAPSVKATPTPAPQPQSAPAVTPDPRDSQYYAQMAKLQFQNQQSLNTSQTQQSYSNQDFQEALRRRAIQHTDDITNQRNSANKAGLFYSGALGKNLGDVESSYQQGNTDLQQGFERDKAARDAARSAIEQGATIDEAGLLAEAVGRQAQRDQTNPPAPVGAVDTTAAPAGSGDQYLSLLHNLNQQSKGTNSPTNLKNIAAMWNAAVAKMRAAGIEPPAASSNLKQYVK